MISVNPGDHVIYQADPLFKMRVLAVHDQWLWVAGWGGVSIPTTIPNTSKLEKVPDGK